MSTPATGLSISCAPSWKESIQPNDTGTYVAWRFIDHWLTPLGPHFVVLVGTFTGSDNILPHVEVENGYWSQHQTDMDRVYTYFDAVRFTGYAMHAEGWWAMDDEPIGMEFYFGPDFSGIEGAPPPLNTPMVISAHSGVGDLPTITGVVCPLDHIPAGVLKTVLSELGPVIEQ